MDHGLEPADGALAAGKDATGTLASPRARGRKVVIEVRDDGRGIDPVRVGANAVTAGLIDAAAAGEIDRRGRGRAAVRARLHDRGDATDISGRGVGMDAVPG